MRARATVYLIFGAGDSVPPDPRPENPQDQSHWTETTAAHWKEQAGSKSNNVGIRSNGGLHSCEALWPQRLVPVGPGKSTWGPQGPKVVPNRKKQRVSMGAVAKAQKDKKAIVADMMSHLTARIDQMSEIFRRIDVNKSGTIDAQELDTILQVVHPEGSPEQRSEIFKAADFDGDGELEFHEFIRLVTKSHSKKVKKMPLRPKSLFGRTMLLPSSRGVSQRHRIGGRSSGACSAMELRELRHPPVTPRLQHGRGAHAEMFDDGLLRTMVSGGQDKVWYDTRDWAKVQRAADPPVARLSPCKFNAHAASSCVHDNFNDTFSLTQPTKGSAWHADANEQFKADWLRTGKGHKHLTVPGMQAHTDPVMRRAAHLNRRSKEIEHEFHKQHDTQLQRHDHRIASIARGRVEFQAVVDAHNERGEEVRNCCRKKRLSPIHSGLGGINGYSTYESLNPGGGEDFYPSRGGRPLQYYTYPTKDGMINLHGHLFS